MVQKSAWGKFDVPQARFGTVYRDAYVLSKGTRDRRFAMHTKTDRPRVNLGGRKQLQETLARLSRNGHVKNYTSQDRLKDVWQALGII